MAEIFFQRILGERERERERVVKCCFFVCQAYWNVQVIFFKGFSENRLVVNTALIGACVVCEVVNCNLVLNVIYDLSVIFNDFSLPSRVIFKDRRRKVYLQLKVDMYPNQKDLIIYICLSTVASLLHDLKAWGQILNINNNKQNLNSFAFA